MSDKSIRILVLVACLLSCCRASYGALSFNVDPNGWPTGWYDAAVANMQTTVNEYNAYGDFTTNNSGNIYVYYNAGIPTAQSGYGPYGGSIGVGGTYPNVRVLLHESSHWLGTGTLSSYWTGPYATALIQQFEGDGAVLNGDSAHYWPYGENYDNESSPINDARHVAMVYALRKDFGVGAFAPPSSATNVTLTASDSAGTSSFNYPWGWSDTHFAQPGTHYSTGNFLLRTPAGSPGWTFAGDSLTVNNTNGSSGGLQYNGSGTTGSVTFKNLILDAGYVRHSSGSSDLFQIAGKVTLNNSPTIDAAQGNISVSASIGGSGSLTKAGLAALTLSGANTYSGSTTINAGTLRLAATPVASYTFDNVSGSTVVNGGNGGSAMNGTLAGGATIVSGGKYGNAVSLASGASVDINSPIADLSNNKSWTVSAWVHTTTSGATILDKGDGSGWASGNSIFYLGDGTAGGSGGVPSAVRNGGGFFQTNLFASKVNDGNWHLVNYVNNAGSYAIYTDGVSQTLSSGNSGFSVADVGSVVRLGVTTNTFASDGTVNYNGLLDNVQFYSQALSAAQIQALYQNQNLGPLPTTTNVTIASGATLDVNGLVQQIGSLTAASGSSISLGAGQLIVSSAANTQASGTISGIAGSLVKDGNGALTLTGSNTYSGGTTIKAGTLRVSNIFGSGTGSGSVTVLTGGTLGGSGAISGAATINGGGHIAPGTGLGTLKVGSLTLASNSILDFELDTVSNVDTSDLVNATGSNGLTLSGGLLNITNLGNMTSGTYTLFDYVGTLGGSVSNVSFGIVPAGFTYSLVNNVSTTSIDLVVTTPLPGDYNSDGFVDATDYVVWQKNVGRPAGTLPNDNTGVIIGTQQYDLWRANFGNGSSSASGASVEFASIPEPNTGVCTMPIFAAILFRRGQRNAGASIWNSIASGA